MTLTEDGVRLDKTVLRHGVGGARINLPPEWIGKTIQVNFLQEARKAVRKCSTCGSSTTYIHTKTGLPEWYRADRTKNTWYCLRCYDKYKRPLRKTYHHKLVTKSNDLQGRIYLPKQLAGQAVRITSLDKEWVNKIVVLGGEHTGRVDLPPEWIGKKVTVRSI